LQERRPSTGGGATGVESNFAASWPSITEAEIHESTEVTQMVEVQAYGEDGRALRVHPDDGPKRLETDALEDAFTGRGGGGGCCFESFTLVCGFSVG
jgi:hypothetical protein